MSALQIDSQQLTKIDHFHCQGLTILREIEDIAH